MAKIKVVDQAVVLTSELTNGQLEKASKFFPEALKLIKEDKKGNEYEVGAIIVGKEGQISSYGVVFPKGAKDEKAAVTVTIPKMDKEAAKKNVKETFGKALMLVTDIENQYKANEEKFDKAYEELDKAIDVE